MTQDLFALVDCNAFYCSCERVFRPDLRTKPVVVLSNNDGCAISRSKEAKALGIKMGEPYFKFKALAEKKRVAVFSSNFSLYQDFSNRVMGLMQEFCPELEVYSIDEAFFNLKGVSKSFEFAEKLRASILKQVGIPVSIGIAATKTLSKVANHIAKKQEQLGGVLSLERKDYYHRALEVTPVEDIWGVGRRLAEKLRAQGIKNALELALFPNEYLIQKIGTKRLRQTQDELRGISCLSLEAVSKKKEIISTRSFGAPLYTLEELRHTVARRVSEAAQKLRAQDSVARAIAVFIQTSAHLKESYYHNYDVYKFSEGTCDDTSLIKAALDLLEKIYCSGHAYKKSGIYLIDIVDRRENQLNLFSTTHDRVDFMRTLDKLNFLYGKHALYNGACGKQSSGQMRQKLKSPRYTTCLTDVLEVF